MKKILVITRPVDNAGDWLITERLIALTEQVAGEAFDSARVDFSPATRSQPVGFYNSYDAIIAGGGPIADDRLLSPSAFHLMSVLEEVNVPVSLIGIGWYGRTPKSGDVYGESRLSEAVRRKVALIEARGGVITSRGCITQSVLEQNGIGSVMTGCPVWYADSFASVSLRGIPGDGPRRIVVSNAGITKEPFLHAPVAAQTVGLLELLGSLFPRASLLFTFNGGIDTKYSAPCNREVADWLSDQGIEYRDISGDASGFALYEECDLHVGYRLHSHLYCLSRGIPSILIEEDARAADANLTLGTPGPKAYDIDDPESRNPWLVEEVRSAVHWYLQSDCAPMKAALHSAACYAPAMQGALRKAMGA